MRILVTGATGFIGSRLVELAAERGDRLVLVSRRPRAVTPPPGEHEVVSELPDLSGIDAVVNLAGEPVLGRRWSVVQRERISGSRLEGTRRVVEAIERADPRPAALVNASAIGFYGDRGDEPLAEESAPGTGFLAEVCQRWEENARAAEAHGVRTVRLRIGVVLGKGGGALAKMLPLFRVGLGGRLGSGRQWTSWIHRDDLCRMILWALDTPEVEGALNGTAPEPVTNREFTRALGAALLRPTIFPAPAPLLRLAVGEASAVLLASQRCIAEKALSAGFGFEFPGVERALRVELGG